MQHQNYYIDQMVLAQVCRLKPLPVDQYQFFPYNCIGFIKASSITHPGEIGFGTGFLVTGCLALTSAHTFYNIKLPFISQSKPISFQLQQSDEKVTKISVINYSINERYRFLIKQLHRILQKKEHLSKSNSANLAQELDKLQNQYLNVYRESLKYDYALLKLEKVIERDQYFQLKIQKQQTNVRLCGYIPCGQKFRIQYQTGSITITPTQGKYDIDSKTGHSGSPILLENSKDKIIGIHKGFDTKLKINVCCLISEEMIDNLQKWTKKFNLNINFQSQQASTNSKMGLQGQIQQMKLQNKQLKQENSDLASKLYTLPMLEKKCTEYENKTLPLLSKEIQRLTFLPQKSSQSSKAGFTEEDLLKKVACQQEDLAKLTSQLQKLKQQEIMNQQIQILNQKLKDQQAQSRKQHELEIQQFQIKINQYESKINLLFQEIEQLKAVTRKAIPESTNSKKVCFQTQSFNKYIDYIQENFNKTLRQNQEKIRLLTQQNQKITRSSKEYQKKIVNSSQQIERLNVILRSKENQVNDLSLKLRTVSQQNQSQKRKMQQSLNYNGSKLAQYETRFAFLGQEIQRLNTILSRRIQEAEKLQNYCAYYKNKVEYFENELSMKERPTTPSTPTTPRSAKPMTKYINDHSFNPHSLNFVTQLKENRLIITLVKSDGNSYAFIMNGILFNNVVSSYQIRIVKTFKTYICFGIATRTVVGELDCFWDKECLTYDLNTGHLWQDGDHELAGRSVNDQEVVSMEVDTLSWKVRWSIGEEVLADTIIPTDMRDKSLYLVICMISKNDVVELLLQ